MQQPPSKLSKHPYHFSTTSSVYDQNDNNPYKGSTDVIAEEPLNISSQDLFGIQSIDSFDSSPNQIDEDVTPKIPQVSNYKDQLDDRTPLMNESSTFSSETNSPNQVSPNLGQSFPKQSLNNKFKRLSVTLQSSTLNASDGSHKFMNNFNNNVRTSMIEQQQQQPEHSKNNRVSIYYNKINDVVVEDEGNNTHDIVRENSINKETSSITSSVSNRSSFVSTEESKHSTNESYESSNNSAFNFTNNPGKVVPLKVVKNTSIPIDDIPVRKDLQKDDVDNDFKGLNISYKEKSDQTLYHDAQSHTSEPNQPKLDQPIDRRDDINNMGQDDEDLSSLFVRALHPFDSSILQSEADASICLAFEKDDLAVVHTIDESGWGEVTLIETLQRGWVPMNFFKFAIDENDEDEEDYEIEEENENFDDGKIPNSSFLKPLFDSCGKFLINPLCHKNRHGKYTFSIRIINSVRDGVKLLLEETDCISRSSEIVTKRPIVRKARKSLLSDWYNLMVKANDFKGTSNFNKIEILTLMIYQVIRRSIEFLKIWSIESKQIIKKENEKKLQNDMNNYPLLPTPPLAKERVTEINGILYSYLGLIIGRLDLIEHNSVGCDLLETLTHHIILLLRELLFISRTGSDASSKKPSNLDNSLDNLLSLVSDLVTAVKCLVIKTLNESVDDQRYQINHNQLQQIKQDETKSKNVYDYYYTPEGGELIQICAKMIKEIHLTVLSVRKLFQITGNFKLNAQRSYPDYSKMRIEPVEFIRQCSIGIAKSNTIKNRQLKSIQPTNKNVSNRYSIMRSGKTGELSLTPGGAGLLHDVLLNDIDGSFSKDQDFAKFTDSKNPENIYNYQDNEVKVENELLVDAQAKLLGASFKGLVYILTNEDAPPDHFFISTFFLFFRYFANGNDLVEELITRFDMQNTFLKNPKTKDIVNADLKLKNRRKAVLQIFEIWLSSYWNFDTDYHLLPTLINFFNEGVTQFLPIHAMKLLDISALLSSRPLTEKTPVPKLKRNSIQLIKRRISMTGTAIKSIEITDNSRYSMTYDYDLTHSNTNSSSSSIQSVTLPFIETPNESTKNQISTIEKLDLTYRAVIGNKWCQNNYINDKHYIPLELGQILPNWCDLCDESWVLTSYRPNLLDFKPAELSRQLTIIESHIFCNIKPIELLHENYSAKRSNLKLAPNVRQSLLFTNCLSAYVLESILQPNISSKLRLQYIQFWLEIGIKCVNLRNYNSLAAIITSLQSHLITRLTKLWDDLSSEYFDLYEYLSGIIHPNKNYTVYRSKLRNLMTNETSLPKVPYFPLFLQDLTFISEGNPNFRKGNDFLNKKLINIDKYLKITRIVADIESLQIPYPSIISNDSNNNLTIQPMPSLQELILLELWKVNQVNKKEEDRSWKLSCMIQPRDAN